MSLVQNLGLEPIPRPKDGVGYAALIKPGIDISGVTSQFMVPDTLYYEPFVLTHKVTLLGLYIELISFVGIDINLSFGIYRADENFQAVSLVADSGNLNINTLGIKSSIFNITLTPDRYLTALVFGTADQINLRAYLGGSNFSGIPRTMLSNIVNLASVFPYAPLPPVGPNNSIFDDNTSAYRHTVWLDVEMP